MEMIKNKLHRGIAFLVLCCMMVTGCKTGDPCKNDVCINGSICQDGTCICPFGYEGEHCERMTRDKFIGQWNVNEDGTLTEPAQYTISIEVGTELDQVLIWNFQNHFTEVVRGVCKADSFFIPLQTFSNGDQVEGRGSIKDKNPFNYTYQPNAYEHADMTLYYQVTNSLGQVNGYGLGGSLPSIWSK